MIQVTHLTKTFRNHAAISDLNFQVKAGEVVGVLGPNGAGKTTTFRCLSGLLEPSSGEIRILDLPVLSDPFSVRRLLGYLTEGNPLVEDLTVREYLNFRFHLKVDSPKDAATTVEKSLQICDLTEVADRVIRRLSHGFRRRVGLAESLLGSPRLLLLDEPTNGLDPEQVVNIRKLLASLKSTHTLLISSHILSELELLCDRFLILSKGELKASGGREEDPSGTRPRKLRREPRPSRPRRPRGRPPRGRRRSPPGSMHGRDRSAERPTTSSPSRSPSKSGSAGGASR